MPAIAIFVVRLAEGRPQEMIIVVVATPGGLELLLLVR